MSLSLKELTWEEKWATLRQIDFPDIKMRAPGDWYVSAGMEHPLGGCMLVGNYGNGKTPQEAIENHWSLYADGEPFYVTGSDQWLRWSGVMWQPSADPRRKIR